MIHGTSGLSIMKWRWWRTADEMAADFACSRTCEQDEKFISDCDLPETELAKRVAIAVRRSVANYGMVESEFVYASDKYPDELIELSGWDSIDFVGWLLELEKELGVLVPSQAFDSMFDGLRLKFSVKDLSEAVYRFMVKHEKVAE